MDSNHTNDEKIKVLRVIGRLIIGGPTIHVINLNNGLNSNRFVSSLACGKENPGERSMLDFAISRGIKPFAIPEMVSEANLKIRDLIAFIKLFRLIRKFKPHIVHTHTAKAGFLGRLAAFFAGVPVIIHTYHGHILHGYYGSIKTWILRRMERMLSALTNCLIAVSEQVKRDLVNYGVASPEKIIVIPIGLNLEPFLNSAPLQGEFRRELGMSDDIRLIGIIGRLFPIKNHRLFLDSAAHVISEDPSTRFVIIGDGALRQELEQHANALGISDKVIFAGWRLDLPCVYADLDVVVVSSNNEGTPVSVIEAMAASCPVVATRVGGIPELISDGQTGYMVPPGDAKALASSILHLLKEPKLASEMAQRACKIVSKNFTSRRLISDIEGVYQDLISR